MVENIIPPTTRVEVPFYEQKPHFPDFSCFKGPKHVSPVSPYLKMDQSDLEKQWDATIGNRGEAGFQSAYADMRLDQDCYQHP